MPFSEEELTKRMDDLGENIEKYVSEANNSGRPDSPARHFHIATISRMRTIGLENIFDDTLYFEYLYATLTAWGMDSRGAKLKGFEKFFRNIRSARDQIMKLKIYSLASLAEQEAETYVKVVHDIWQVILTMDIAQGKSQLVTGSKTLHHLLPDLVPPIDREYTLKFFFDRKTITKNVEADFVQVLTNYTYIYGLSEESIQGIVGNNPLNTSVTKVIDNAIIGCRPKGKRSMWTT